MTIALSDHQTQIMQAPLPIDTEAYPAAVPALLEAKSFAENSFQSLSAKDREVRLQLCAMVEEAAIATADGEDLDVLRAAAYLQEVGVIHSSRNKARFSLSMCEKIFSFIYGDLDYRLLDCIRNHVRPQVPKTPEGLLMQICHKYVTSHFLDYIRMKGRLSEKKISQLTVLRIDALEEYLEAHPRGEDINRRLQAWFHGLRTDC